MEHMIDIENKTIAWAEKRNIFKGSDPISQCDKLLEELSELLDGFLDDNHREIIDGIGDMLVVLTILAHFAETDLTTCFNYAYNQIKDRTGKMIDGIFVKDK